MKKAWRRLFAPAGDPPPPAPASASLTASASLPRGWHHLDLMGDALEHLREKGLAPRAVLDVGAAQGAWSEKAAEIFPEARFHMFDPLTENEPLLRSLCQRDARFDYTLTALGARPDTLTINVSQDLQGSSLLEFPGQDSAHQRKVPVDTVDRLIAEGRVPMPELVKLDVQGFELEVMAGARSLLGPVTAFVVEVSLFEFMPRCPLAPEVVSFFVQHGYRLFDLAGLLRRPHQNDLGQMDLVFVSASSPMVADRRWA